MPVAQAAASAAQKLNLLSVAGHFGKVFARLGVVDDRSAGYVDDDVVAVLTEAASAGAALAVAGKYVAAVFQRQERPHVGVAAKYDVAAASAVATVGASLGDVFGAVKVARAGAALAGAAKYLYVVDEI